MDLHVVDRFVEPVATRGCYVRRTAFTAVPSTVDRCYMMFLAKLAYTVLRMWFLAFPAYPKVHLALDAFCRLAVFKIA